MKYQKEVVNWVESNEYHSEMNIYIYGYRTLDFPFGGGAWKVFILKKGRSINRPRGKIMLFMLAWKINALKRT